MVHVVYRKDMLPALTAGKGGGGVLLYRVIHMLRNDGILHQNREKAVICV